MPARFVALFVFLMAAFPAFADEFILSYHSIVEVAKNGTLTVTETITARAEGDRIQRGIFRDFPLYAQDQNGKRIKVGFKVVSVERDGAREDWHTESVEGGIRIYTGNAERILPTGEHRFQITYTTDRQIRYFNTYDELTWNVTGNGWQFPMREVSATVSLPAGASVSDTAVFTGRLGAKGKDARILTEGNEVFFASTRPFYQGEGMTVAVKLPKGVLDAPSATDLWNWLLQDNRALAISGIGFFVVFIYYLRAWFAVGRDPAKGTIIPQWKPPEGLSPALVNYIDRKGFAGDGWVAFSSAILNLAVKGYVKIEAGNSTMVVTRTEKSFDKQVPTGERTILQKIDDNGKTLTISRSNGATVANIGRLFRQSIEREHGQKYYRANSWFTAIGIMLSVCILAALIKFGDVDDVTYTSLVVTTWFSIFVGIFAVRIGRNARQNKALIHRIGIIIISAFAAFSVIIIFWNSLQTLWKIAWVDANIPVTFFVGLIVLVNVLFLVLMGAPTPLGRKLMDGIEGLRLYLQVAEKDRMNMQNVPQMSPQHFESLLPYAVALGLEKPWSQKFETWLASAAAGATTAAVYTPVWCSGEYKGSFSDMSSSMASTIESTIPQASSSGSSGSSGGGSFSGGGGFSGSGGGGGGGGGW